MNKFQYVQTRREFIRNGILLLSIAGTALLS